MENISSIPRINLPPSAFAIPPLPLTVLFRNQKIRPKAEKKVVTFVLKRQKYFSADFGGIKI